MATEIGQLVASFQADTRDFDAKLKRSEASLASLKARIKEVNAEASSPVKGVKLEGLQASLRSATVEHKALLQLDTRDFDSKLKASGANLDSFKARTKEGLVTSLKANTQDFDSKVKASGTNLALLKARTKEGLVASFKANTQDFDSKVKRSETGLASFKGQIKSVASSSFQVDTRGFDSQVKRSEAGLASLKARLKESASLQADTRNFDAKLNQSGTHLALVKSQVKEVLPLRADTHDFDAKLKASEARVNSLKANIASVRTDSIGGKTGRVNALQSLLGTATRDHKALQAAHIATAKTAQQAGQAISQDLGGALSTLSPRLAGLAGAAGPLSVVAAALVAVGAAAAGIYKLVESSAGATGKLHDLSQQTGFAVETLSALQNAAETSGGSIESITSALFLFETKMGEAKDKSSEMSKVFQALGVDTTNNEKALRQSITALLAMNNAEDQATIGKKLFGRSVKDLMGAIKEAGGLDAFLNKQLQDGTLITTEAAKRGDQLSDSITTLRRKFSATGRLVADEFAPLVSDALSEFSTWLRNNQKELINTAREVATLIKDISGLAKFLYSISPIRLEIQIVRTIKTFVDDVFPGSKDTAGMQGSSLFDKFKGYMGQGPTPTGPGGALGRVDMSKVANQTQAQIAATAKGNTDAVKRAASEQKKVQDALNDLLKGNGSAKGRGSTRKSEDPAIEALKTLERLTELRLVSVLTGLKVEEEANKRNLDRQLIDFEEYSVKRSVKESERHMAIMGQIDSEKKATDAVKDPNKQAIAYQEIVNKRQEELIRHKQAEQNIADEIADILLKILATTESTAAAYSRIVDYAQQARDAMDFGGVQTAAKDLEDFIKNTEPPEPTASEALVRVRQQIRDDMNYLGYNLTRVFSQSIGDGFEQGAKRGLATLAQGMLNIVQQIFLRKLAEGLGSIFSDMAGVGSGRAKGGGIGGILQSAIGSLLGVFGGGKKFGGKEIKPDATYTAGGTGATRARTVGPQDITAQTRDRNSATAQQTNALSNSIQLTGQSIVNGLRPAQEGFLSGLLKAAVGGAISGLTGGLTSGITGSKGHVEGPKGPRPTTVPTRHPFEGRGGTWGLGSAFAAGGILRPGSWGTAGERGMETIYGGQSGMTIFPNRAVEQSTVNKITINVPVSASGSYSSKKSRRQLAEEISSALQGALV